MCSVLRSVAGSSYLSSSSSNFLSELRRATCPERSHSFFCSFFPPAEFLVAASNFSLSIASGPDKVSYPMLNHLSCSGMDFLLHFSIFPEVCIPSLPSGRHLSLFPSIKWKSLSTLPLPSGLSLSPPAYQSCFNASFYLVYSSFLNLILFSLPSRPVSALNGLL